MIYLEEQRKLARDLQSRIDKRTFTLAYINDLADETKAVAAITDDADKFKYAKRIRRSHAYVVNDQRMDRKLLGILHRANTLGMIL